MAKTKKDSAKEPIMCQYWMVADKLMWYQEVRELLTALRDTLLPKLMSGEVRVETNNA
jgi:hypothetical protein